MIARHLGISSTAARDLVKTLDLHEMTGRQRLPRLEHPVINLLSMVARSGGEFSLNKTNALCRTI